MILLNLCLKEPLLIPESITLMKLLNVLRTEGVHETIVLDEYGGFSGLVTLHDIMEEIVGLMPSGEEEIKEEENKIIEREDGSWLVDGLLDVETNSKNSSTSMKNYQAKKRLVQKQWAVS